VISSLTVGSLNTIFFTMFVASSEVFSNLDLSHMGSVDDTFGYRELGSPLPLTSY